MMRPERLRESTSLLVVALANTSIAVFRKGVSDCAEAMATRAEAKIADLINMLVD